MAKSEAAKALEAKQKAAVAAEKARRKASDNPRDWGTVRTVRELFKLTTQADPSFGPKLFAVLFGPLVLLLVLGLVLAFSPVHLAWWNVLLMALTGLAIGVLLATLLLQRRAKSSMIDRYEGQAGSAEIALQMLPKEWRHTAAIAFTRQMDVVHRAVGPGGLFLVGEGDTGRVRALLAQQTKKHETAFYGVKAKTVIVGNGEGQVPLKDLTKYLSKQPKSLDEAKVAQAAKRYQALDAIGNKLGAPAGPLPTRGAHRAMRGR